MPIRSSDRPADAQLQRLREMPDDAIDFSDAPALDDWRGAVRGHFATRRPAARRVALPAAVSRIFEAVEELERRYPDRKFTPDGHLVGSIGEVVAAEALGLKLHPMSHAGHDAYDDSGDVQIKLTAGKSVAMYGPSVRLVVLQVVSHTEAEIVYDGPGQLPWDKAGKLRKNGQRTIGLKTLRALV